ncbi:MAG: serine hydrolase [Gammaproteobacteria bacterium]|nr:serine hydrolase [Gammaproteobacteria bacterium]
MVMTRLTFVMGLGLFAVMASTALAVDLPRGGPEEVGMSAERLEQVRAQLDRFVENGEFPGITALVARRGKVVFEHTTGLLDVETGAELEPDSLLRVYSMTKPITSVGAMMLVEDGRLLLDEPVANFFPGWKHLTVLTESGDIAPASAPVTPRHLLTHTSGLTYGYDGDSAIDRMYREARLIDDWDYLTRDTRELVEKLAGIPLLFEPGTRWRYSFATDVLGHLIERVSGKSLDVYLQSRLFGPLGMTDSYFDVPPDAIQRFGTNHVVGKGGELIVQDNPREDPEFIGVTFLAGGGGLVMTAEDYMRFCFMLLNGGALGDARILSPAMVALMTGNLLPEGMQTGEQPGFGFGLGFGIAPSGIHRGTLTPGSYYWAGAAGTFFWIDPGEQLIGLFMPQRINMPARIRTTLENLVYAALTEYGR